MLAVSTAKTKATRYDRADYPRRILADTLTALEEADILTRQPYLFKQLTTTVEPTKHFADLLQRHGVRMGDIGRDRGGETIWLYARTGAQGGASRNPGLPPPKVLVPYADTGQTRRLRSEMDRLSGFLNGAGIAYAGEPLPPVALRRIFLLRSPTDRVTFNLSGRIAGGFWMSLKSDKRHLITIGGEEVADLDFVAMWPMLAYLRAGGRLPVGDPYSIPGLEHHRAGAKLGLLSLLSRGGEMKRLSPELKAALPEGWDASRLTHVMLRRHPEIAFLFRRGLGLELMNTESNILMAVLTSLAAQGVAGLGMHDGLLVAKSQVAVAMETMRRVSGELLGVELPMKEKPITGHYNGPPFAGC